MPLSAHSLIVVLSDSTQFPLSRLSLPLRSSAWLFWCGLAPSNLELRGRNDKLSCVQFSAIRIAAPSNDSAISGKLETVIVVFVIHLCICWLAVAIDDFQVEAYEDCGSCIN